MNILVQKMITPIIIYTDGFHHIRYVYEATIFLLQATIVKPIFNLCTTLLIKCITEIKNRLKFLIDVGLDYLTLSREASTLSGGESQRIRLATQIGSKLTGVLYVLDEPSIGLHQRDNDKLINTRKERRDLGNSLIVVEHDEDTILAADYVVDRGKGAGDHGGEVIYSGTPKGLREDKDSLTGDFLSGRKRIAIPSKRRSYHKRLEIKNAYCHNLKHIDVSLPIGCLTVVTGVSGSGKSSLIDEVLYKTARSQLGYQ